MWIIFTWRDHLVIRPCWDFEISVISLLPSTRLRALNSLLSHDSMSEEHILHSCNISDDNRSVQLSSVELYSRNTFDEMASHCRRS